MPLIVRVAAEAAGADLAAIYVLPEQSPATALSSTKPPWRLGGYCGADAELLSALPTSFGAGGGILRPAFGRARQVNEGDLLDGAPDDAPLPVYLPVRSIAAVPIRRRDSRPIGVLVIGARRAHAFDDEVLDVVRRVAQLIGVAIDMARLAAAQQRERRIAAESAVTLGTVLESIDNGVCVVELDGTLRVINKTLQDLFGLSGRIVGNSQLSVFASAAVKPRDPEAFETCLRELLADPSKVDETEWELATDPPRVIQRYSAPMRSMHGVVVGRVEVYTDVTESRRLYTKLLNSEKLRAIGEMASGVAHDFNNLLASIVGQTELLHPDELPPATRQAISTIRQAALDGARMVRNLQGLSRPRAETPSTAADLNETVSLAVEMARPRWAGRALTGHGAIEVTLELAEPTQLARVAIDPAELREVLLNLLFNAVDAMPEGGRITLATRPGRKPSTAEVEVRDSGHGMPESVRARIFEPFFSTKGPKGSGLGLAVAFSIISRHGGRIEVASTQGEGTTFTITLLHAPTTASPQPAQTPAVSRPSAEAPGARSQPSLARLQGARVLVADDEPGLITIVRQFMERSGATVTVANGGRPALEFLEAPDARFDVVITDLDMPEVDGWAVASTVKARLPQTPVIMLTGWAGEIAPEDFKARGVDLVLAKPCGRAELEAAVGTLLTPRPTAGLDVLLVDDEPAFARAVSELLKLQGHQVTVVDSGARALDALQERSYRVVLTDYSLGQMTGAQLAERIAGRAERPYVVLITGYATEIDDPTLMSVGVDAVLPKPCRGDDLRQVLGRVTA